MLKRFLAALALTCIVAAPVNATDWRGSSVPKSLVQLELQDDAGSVGSCTAFSINQKERYYLTAAHCIGPMYTTLDEQMVFVLYFNETLDLAVIEAPASVKLRPALKPARQYQQGQEIAAWGYGYGWDAPGIMAGQIYGIWADGPWEGIITNFPLIPGMSGGPAVDVDGGVVGINQMADNRTGFTASIKTILSVTGKFWERR